MVLTRRRYYRRRRRNRRNAIFSNIVNQSPVAMFTHKFRLPNAIIAGAGNGHVFSSFGLLQASYDYPVNGSGGNGYFDESNPLKAMLRMYEKYKLISVKMIANNFRFFRIKCYIPMSTKSEDAELLWKYFETKYKDEITPSRFDSSKFTITEEELLTMPIEYFYDHTTPLHGPVKYDYRPYNAWFVPPSRTVCTKRTRFVVSYYPRGLHCAETGSFFVTDASHRTFPDWMQEMSATQSVPLLFARPSMGVLSVIGSDLNAIEFVVVQNNIDVYYRFKFAAKIYDTTV